MQDVERISPLSVGSLFKMFVGAKKVNLESTLDDVIEEFGLQKKDKIEFSYISSGNSSYAIPIVMKHQQGVGVQKGKSYTTLFQRNIQKKVLVDYKLTDSDIKTMLVLQYDFHTETIDVDDELVGSRAVIARMHVRESSKITIIGVENVCLYFLCTNILVGGLAFCQR